MKCKHGAIKIVESSKTRSLLVCCNPNCNEVVATWEWGDESDYMGEKPVRKPTNKELEEMGGK